MAKKSHNAINIVSIISVAGVIIGTVSFVLILSVFNGFDLLVKSLYSSFYPDIHISASEGKTFTISDSVFSNLLDIEGVVNATKILEDNALVTNGEKQAVARIKGVSDSYSSVSDIDSLIWRGEYKIKYGSMPRMVIGRGLYYYLGVTPEMFEPISVYAPKRGVRESLDPNRMINRKSILVSGIFASQPEIDEQYALVPLEFAQGIFDYPNDISAIEIKTDKNISERQIIRDINDILGDDFIIKNRYQQNEILYKTMRSEKWAIFFILALVLIILVFSLVGSISMLIIEKKNDIQILNSLGANYSLLRKIFFREGLLITLTGAISGLLFGSIVAILQEKFKLVKIHGGFIIDAYPVDIQWIDILIVSITVLSIGSLASYYPIRFLLKKNYKISF